MALGFLPEAAAAHPLLNLLIKTLFLPLIFVAALLGVVRLYTSIRYHYDLRRFNLAPENTQETLAPPQIPYTLPFLGVALEFLAPYPGVFWSNLFRKYPRSTGVCSLFVGGKSINVLSSPTAVHAMFRMRTLDRRQTNRSMLIKGFGLNGDEFDRYYDVDESNKLIEEHVFQELLLKTDSVNELTANFSRALRNTLTSEDAVDETAEVGLYSWIQKHTFIASVVSIMGDRLLEVYPEVARDFIDFDRDFMSMFFGIPRWVSPEPYNVRDRVLGGLERWRHAIHKESSGQVPDPFGEISWEPLFGSRMNRARTKYYECQKLSPRGRASFDLGLLFGLASNSIPAVGWMLMHTLNPLGDKTLYGRIMEELKPVQKKDGTLDIPTLLTLPLLQSMFHEVLRVYADVLVSRDLQADLVLPLDESGKKKVYLNKNASVMAPSWIGHHDETEWSGNAPCDTFYAERFLKADPETGKVAFSLTGTVGKYFPFGGGKSICPGRVFAKQEVLASVALLLLGFDFEVIGFMDEKGGKADKFPGLRNAYLGSGVVVVGGDMKVKIKRRAV